MNKQFMEYTSQVARVILMILFLGQGSISVFALAPESGFAPKTPSLESLRAKKLKELMSHGHDPFLAERLVESQIRVAQRSALLLSRALDDKYYLIEFPASLTYLQKSAEFFGVSRNDLARIVGVPLDANYFLYAARACWDMQRDYNEKMHAIGQRGHEGLNLGEKPTQTTLKDFLDHQIEYFGDMDFSLSRRAKRWVESVGRMREQVLDELTRVLEDFLYAERHAMVLYEYFSLLQEHWNIPVSEVIQHWRDTRLPSQKEILHRIEESGKLTYAQYMELVVYDPVLGYYTKPRTDSIIGKEFATIPQLTPRFGEAVAADLLMRWKELDKPKNFDAIEMGAGEGHLAKYILRYIDEQAEKNHPDWRAFAQAIKYTIVEISPSLMEKQKTKLGKFSERVTWKQGNAVYIDKIFPPHSVQGVFLSNELPDAFPIHKVRRVGGRLQEIFVRVQNGFLVEELGEPSTSELAQYLQQRGIELSEGEGWIINLNAERWMKGMTASLRRGAILIFDYGDHSDHYRSRCIAFSPTRSYGGIAFQKMLKYMGLSIPRDETQARYLEEAKKSQGKDAFFEARLMSYESGNHLLAQVGEKDLTTDLDFEAMFYGADRAGFWQESFGTQDEYITTNLAGDEEKLGQIDEQALAAAHHYKYQTLVKHKKEPTFKETGLERGAFDLFLRKGLVHNAQDMRTFLNFLEQYNVAGLAKMAKALKTVAQTTGRPLAGISDDCLIQMVETMDGSPLFHREKGFLQKTVFPVSIPIKAGMPMDEVLMALANCLPTMLFPDDYQDVAREITPVEQGMPFQSVYHAFLKRKEIERAMGLRMQAEFAMGLTRLGYSLDRCGLQKKEVEKTVHQHWHNLRKRVISEEPNKSMIRLEALLTAAQVFFHADGDPILVNTKEFLQKDGPYFKVDWYEVSEFIMRISAQFLPGAVIDWVLDDAIEYVPERDILGVKTIFSHNKESVEARIAMTEAIVQAIDRKFPPLGPVYKELSGDAMLRLALLNAAA